MADSLAQKWAEAIDTAIKDSEIYMLAVGSAVISGVTTPMAGTCKATNFKTKKNLLQKNIRLAFKANEALIEGLNATAKASIAVIENTNKVIEETDKSITKIKNTKEKIDKKVNELLDSFNDLIESMKKRIKDKLNNLNNRPPTEAEKRIDAALNKLDPSIRDMIPSLPSIDLTNAIENSGVIDAVMPDLSSALTQSSELDSQLDSAQEKLNGLRDTINNSVNTSVEACESVDINLELARSLQIGILAYINLIKSDAEGQINLAGAKGSDATFIIT